MARKETKDITAKLPKGVNIMIDRRDTHLGGLEWRLGLYKGDGFIILTSEGTKEFEKRIHYTQSFILDTEFRVGEEPDGDTVLNIATEQLEEGDLDPLFIVEEQYHCIYRGGVLKNGEPLIDLGYKTTGEFLEMSVIELREEILGSFGLDYLEENGFIEKSNWNE